MIDLKQIQKDVYQNKLDKGFNVTDINKEFCLTYGEEYHRKIQNLQNLSPTVKT